MMKMKFEELFKIVPHEIYGSTIEVLKPILLDGVMCQPKQWIGNNKLTYSGTDIMKLKDCHFIVKEVPNSHLEIKAVYLYDSQIL